MTRLGSWSIPLAALGLLAMSAVLGGQQGPDCIPVTPTVDPCADALDCEGLPHTLCDGQWSCQGGQCVWACETCVKEGEMGSSMIEPMYCCEGLDAISVANWDPVTGMCGMMSDVFLCSKCGNGICESDWENPCNCNSDCETGPTDAQALCAETGGQWNSCGSGCGPWSCGKPVQTICPGVCISQCECGAGQGWDPVEGCVTCTCAQWFETWQSLLAQVTQCSSADDCIDVPGTSCGCTRNLVVNKDENLWLFWEMAGWMADNGCGPFVSTCDCPAADGFACVDGQCAWNYL